MKGNTFENNVGAGVIRFDTLRYDTSTSKWPSSTEIIDNVFVNNRGISNDFMFTVTFTGKVPCTRCHSLANNVFDNPAATSEVEPSNQRVDASGCYWSVTSHDEIMSR